MDCRTERLKDFRLKTFPYLYALTFIHFKSSFILISLIQRATTFPKRTAIISDNKDFSYRQLLDTSISIAKVLLNGKADLQEGRIAFMVPPSFEYAAVQWGIWQAGGIAVPLCVLHPKPALQYVLEDTRASILIVHPDYEKLLEPIAVVLNIRVIKWRDIFAGNSKPISQSLPEISLNRRAMILYTSGTTSLPKGVVTTHANIEAQITTLVKAWEWQRDDHILNILPLHHVHGIINVMSCALWSGAICEFLPKFDAAEVWDKFLEKKLTLFMAVPTIYFKLIAFWESATKERRQQMSASGKHFRLMVSGSAALPVSVLEKWQSITGQILLERYGMTEIGMGLSNAYRGVREPGHVGLPLPGVQLRLVDEQDQPVEKGTPGEIHIKGPSVFLEYWQKPEATEQAFTQDGWFRTGDRAVLTKINYKILGRNSVDIIKSGGYKISALEIEEVLRTHPLIKECGIIGLANEEWGEIIGAGLVIGHQPPDFEELKLWLKERLPGYKIPRKFLILEDLPRNTLGKVTKNELKKMFD